MFKLNYHCLITSHNREWVQHCIVLNDCDQNTSDHFAVGVTLDLPVLTDVSDVDDVKSDADAKKFYRVNWKDAAVREAYMRNVADLSESLLPPVDVTECSSQEEIQTFR